MLSWFKNRIKGGNNTKYKFKQRKKDSWRNITTLLNQDGVPGGGASSSPNSPLFNRFEQSSNISTGRRPHSLSEDSDNSAASTANRSGVSNKPGSSTTSTSKTVRFKLSVDSKVSLDSTRAYLDVSFDSGEGDTCSEKSFTEVEKTYKKLDSKKIDQLQSAFSSARIQESDSGEAKSDGEASDANSGVNSNHSSEESGHTVNSSGLGSSIMDGNNSSGSGGGTEHKYDKNGRYSLSGSYDSNGKNVGSKYSPDSRYNPDSKYTSESSKSIPKSQYYSENKYRSPVAWTDSKYDPSSKYDSSPKQDRYNTPDKNSTLSHSKSVKVKPAIPPQIRQVKLQRHKSTIGSHSNIRSNILTSRSSVKKSSSISYKNESSLFSSENPNGVTQNSQRTTGGTPDVRTLYEQRLKQFQQQNPSMDPTRKVLTRNMSRINSNPTQHHINLVRTMSTNAKMKKSFKDDASSVLYA